MSRHTILGSLQTDRFDRLIRGSVVALFAIPLLGAIASVGALVCILTLAPRTPHEWFAQVVGVNVSAFRDIRHFTIQGVDFSHHFKFSFENRADLDAIISAHALDRAPTAGGLFSDSLPEWYDLDQRAFITRRYRNDQTHQVYSLFVDDGIYPRHQDRQPGFLRHGE